MKILLNKKYITIAVYVCICAAIILTLYFAGENLGVISKAFERFNSIMSPVYLGLIFAYVANPLMVNIETHVLKFKHEHKTLKRALALLLTYLVIFAIITAFLMLLLPQVIASYNDLYSRTGVFINELIPNIENFFTSINSDESTAPNFNDIYDKITELIDIDTAVKKLETTLRDIYSLFQTYVPNVLNYISLVFVGFKNVFLGFVFSIYFLAEKEKLCAMVKKVIRSILNEKSYVRLFSFLTDTDKKFGSFIVGKIVDSLIIGVITFAVLGIIGMPYYPLISVIVCVTNVIPFIGPFIGAIPCAFIVLMESPLYCLIFIIFIIVLQQIDGNYIGPKILGDAIGINSLWILTAITIMGGYFGLVGMLIGAPLFAVIYSLVKKLVESRLTAKELPVETECYFKAYTDDSSNTASKKSDTVDDKKSTDDKQ